MRPTARRAGPGRAATARAGGAGGRPAPAARRPRRTGGALEPEPGAAPPARLARLLERYGGEEGVVAELEALAEHAAARAAEAAAPPAERRRTAPTAAYAAAAPAEGEKRARMFTVVDPSTGRRSANPGANAGGRRVWWALRVNPGREKKLEDAIHRVAEFMAPVEGAADGSPARVVETWAPLKKVRAWNPK
jgi:hypothetical protein